MYVDLKALEKVKIMCSDTQNRIIFVPLNKSFTDLLLLNYINFMHGLPIGFTFGSLEDTPRMLTML
jgi:glycerol-3-phosphate O-acyltransferase